MLRKYLKTLIYLSIMIIITAITLIIPKTTTTAGVTTVKPTIYASSAIVMEQGTKRVLFGQNINEKLLPASITKILTCITALEYYDLNDLIVVKHEMIFDVVGSKIYLAVGDVISVHDLLYGLMLFSGNDAAAVLSYHYSGNPQDFIYLMNKTANKIGMVNSTFTNPSGLDETTRNYTTAKDMALLMCYALNNNTFREITKTKTYYPTIASGRKLYFTNKHRLIQTDNSVTGGKTGYTKLAHRTLVTSFLKDNMEIVVVTFNCSDDWNAHRSLANYAFSNYHLEKVTTKINLYFSLIPYGKFSISTKDTLFPIAINEDQKNVQITLNYTSNQAEIMYILNEKEEGSRSVSARK